jgi:hypothetical protein
MKNREENSPPGLFSTLNRRIAVQLAAGPAQPSRGGQCSARAPAPRSAPQKLFWQIEILKNALLCLSVKAESG